MVWAGGDANGSDPGVPDADEALNALYRITDAKWSSADGNAPRNCNPFTAHCTVI